jgi:hypothetical protein
VSWLCLLKTGRQGHNKCILQGLGETVNFFTRYAAKKPPVHPSRKYRRYVLVGVSNMDINQLNQSQKLVIGICTSLLVLLFFSHNPFQGYQTKTEHLYYINRELPPCDKIELNKYRQFLADFYTNRDPQDSLAKLLIEKAGSFDSYIDSRASKCHMIQPGLPTDSKFNKELKTKTTKISILNWYSLNPTIKFFASLRNFMFSLLSVISIGSVFVLFVFNRKAHNNITQKDE